MFRDFGSDYRSGGQFDPSLTRLKDRLADPVADRIVEALRLTREVGGSDLGRLLGTLAEFLRESARTRSELEARQSWTVNAARLAVAAPWIVLVLLASRPEAVAAYNTPVGGRRPAGRPGGLPDLLCRHAAHRRAAGRREGAPMTGLMAAPQWPAECPWQRSLAVLVRLPFMRPTTFVDRIAPQLKSHNLESRLLRTVPGNITPFGPLERILRRSSATPSRGWGGSTRLHGPEPPAGKGRKRQVAGGFPGRAAAVGRGRFCRGGRRRRAFGAAGRFSPLLAVVLVLGSAAGGFLFRDYLLGAPGQEARGPHDGGVSQHRRAYGAGRQRRRERHRRAGPGVPQRPGRAVQGIHPRPGETRAGKPLVEALQEFSSRTELGAPCSGSWTG